MKKSAKYKNIKIRPKFGKARMIITCSALAIAVGSTVFCMIVINDKAEKSNTAQLKDATITMQSRINTYIANTDSFLKNLANFVSTAGAIDGDAVYNLVQSSEVGTTGATLRLYSFDGYAIVDGERLTSQTKFDPSTLGFTGIDDCLIQNYKIDPFNPLIDVDDGNGSTIKEDNYVIEHFVPVMEGTTCKGILSAVFTKEKMEHLVPVNLYGGEGSLIVVDTEIAKTAMLNNEDPTPSLVIGSSSFSFSGISPAKGYNIENFSNSAYEKVEDEIRFVNAKGVAMTMSTIPLVAKNEISKIKGVENWAVMVQVPQSVAFKNLQDIEFITIMMIALMVVIFAGYTLYMFLTTRKQVTKQAELELALKIKRERKQLTDIIFGLSEDYSLVVIADSKTLKDTIFRANESFAKLIPNWSNITDLATRLQAIAETFIEPADREDFYRQTRRTIVLENLANNPAYFVNYKITSNRNTEYWQARFSLTNSQPSQIVVGFHNIDNEVITNERRIAVISDLSEDFDSVAYVELFSDKMEDLCHEYKTTELLSKIIPSWNEESSFHDRLELIADNLVVPEDREKFVSLTRREYLLASLANQPAYVVNFEAQLLGNERKYYSFKFTADRNQQGEIIGIIAGLHSVDEETRERLAYEKKLSQEHQELEKALVMADSANRAKTTFLNSMSHDIRTPMNAIIGFTRLATNHIENTLQVEDYLMKINRASNHLLSLINDVLDMSRIESGHMKINEANENLADISHLVYDVLSATANEKGIEYHMTIHNLEHDAVLCDALRVKQVLVNIISNAIKYTPAGGKVLYSITEKKSPEPGKVRFVFEISDNGIGMSKEYLKNIFVPFSREKDFTHSGIQGSGLGMSITKTIIDMIGGTISIDSDQGVGTKVTVIFDFKKADEQCSHLVQCVKNKRALLVSSDKEQVEYFRNLLETCGMEVDVIENASNIVSQVSKLAVEGKSYKMLLIDYENSNPGNAYDIKKIRRVVGDETIIFIPTEKALSNFIDERSYARYLTKPLFPTDFFRLLERYTNPRTVSSSFEQEFIGHKVLLVEDNELNQEIAVDILQELGIEVLVSADGEEAVKKVMLATPGEIELIFMDIQMPKLDGLEATKQIRALEGDRFKDIPIIAMTANAFEEDRKAALASGMNDFITKPIEIKKLNRILATYLK